jgi:hypothetical protein
VAYRHTQAGWVLIIILGGISALLAMIAVSSDGPESIVLVAVVVLLVVCLALFSSLTAIVDERGVEVRMGPGVVRRRVALDEIETVTPRHLPWWAVAYGVRMSLDGRRMLWRVSGSETVDLELTRGRRLLIGTDEPGALAAALDAALRRAGADGS